MLAVCLQILLLPEEKPKERLSISMMLGASQVEITV